MCQIDAPLVVADNRGILRQRIVAAEAKTRAAVMTIFIISRLRAIIKYPLGANTAANFQTQRCQQHIALRVFIQNSDFCLRAGG
ncbi:hypothetical protein D3C76_1713670 [compost metagenome]